MDDCEAVRSQIYSIDSEFDLVMIAEYFDESLILLKNLMCWTTEDIAFVRRFKTDVTSLKKVTDLTDESREG